MKSFKYIYALTLLTGLFCIFSFANASVDIIKKSQISTGVDPFGIAIGPNNTIITVGYTCGCLTIHDVSNKTSPTTLVSTSTNSNPGFVVTNGNYAYIGTANGKLETWDLSNQSVPVRLGTYSFPAGYGTSKMRLSGNNLFVTYYQGGFAGPGGIRIFSVSNPATTTVTSSIAFALNTSGVGDVLQIGNYLYVADYFGKTLRVYDISNIASPVLRQNITGVTEPLDYATFEPWRLLNKGNALYLSDDNIVQVYDISSSTNMVYATTTIIFKDSEGIDIKDNILYTASSFDNTVALYDITDPFNIRFLSSKNSGQNNYWMAIDSNGYYYINSTSDETVNIYDALAIPTISTSSPTSVSTTTVTLNASITSNNNASSTDRGFNYGATTGYGSVASTTGTFNIGAFSQNLTGLTCNTLYHYRVFATNIIGTATSSDQTFTTSSCPVAVSAPTVTTGAASSITTTSATMNGTITSDGNASSTARGFVYGTDSGLTTGIATSSTSGTFGVGAFTGLLSSLTCNTTYYYKSFATNSAGTSYGSIVSFATSACASSGSSSTSSSGSSVSAQTLAILLGQTSIPGCPAGFVCRPSVLTTGTSVVRGTFTRNLSAGTSHSEVKTLQQYLNAKGYLVSVSGAGSPGKESNTFGGLTKKALTSFQKTNGIPATGYFGPLTRAFIQAHP